MRALVWDGGLYLKDVAKPVRQAGEVLLKTVMAGICNTDLEITRGYVPGFRGILGHEFVAYVEDADDTTLTGKRVTGSINIACGHCDMCRRGMEKHCLERNVLGIRHKDGAFAELLTLPAGNIVEIPRSMADDHAVFLEPLAAALEILHQAAIGRDHSVLLIGDGKLGLLTAFVLATTNCNLTVLGRHENKLRVLGDSGIDTLFEGDRVGSLFDFVIETSGNSSGFMFALEHVRPEGTIVLKSTYAEPFPFNPAAIVVNEINVIGSRCGDIREAVGFLEDHRMPLDRLISARFPLDRAVEAFEYSLRPDAIKVLLSILPENR